MKPEVHLVLVIFPIVVAVILSFYFFWSETQFLTIPTEATEIALVDSNCTSCTNSLPYSVRTFLEAYNYAPNNSTLYLGSKEGDNLTEKYVVTALPSLVFPVSALNGNSNLSIIVSALLYENILTFNQGQEEFVLNTPFSSAIFGPVRYYSPLQNRIITSKDILNYTLVYGTTNPLERDVINPTTAVEEINASQLDSNNKTDIYFIYGNSPFSGLESLILRDALKNFGSFSRNVTYYSSSIKASGSITLGPQLSYDLSASNYSSKHFQIKAYDISDLTNATAQELVAQYDQNLFYMYNTSGFNNFEPLIDIGGRYVVVSSPLKPYIFNELNQSQIEKKLSENESLAFLFNRSVMFIDSLLCEYENSSQICSNPTVEKFSSVYR
ncbi:MAG: hypothetical protein RAK22_01420 [Nanoarchaeota archaeon]|nr:hypothetical protein [Nanoarchaeota archaeon]